MAKPETTDAILGETEAAADAVRPAVDRKAVVAEARRIRDVAIREGMELWDLDEVNAEVNRRRSR